MALSTSDTLSKEIHFFWDSQSGGIPINKQIGLKVTIDKHQYDATTSFGVAWGTTMRKCRSVRVAFIALSVALTACLGAIWVHSRLADIFTAFPLRDGGEWGIEYTKGDILFGCNPGPHHGGEPGWAQALDQFTTHAYHYAKFQPPQDLHYKYLSNPWGGARLLSRKPAPKRSHWEMAGFVLERGMTTLVLVPIWWLVAISSVPGIALCLPEFRAHLRSRGGRCEVCGYDLRASPGRCPECGNESRPLIN